MSEFLQVMTAVDTKEGARGIAREVVGQRKGACVQILGPVLSTYRWRERVEEEEEWLCLIKSRKEVYPALEEVIRAKHPYDEPEIIALPIAGGSRGYLDWIIRHTE